MSGQNNRIQYGLARLYYAPMTETDAGGVTYATPVPLPGAVSISLSARGERLHLSADNGSYLECLSNGGYDGELVLALIPARFRAACLGERQDAAQGSNVTYETAELITQRFALLGQFDGDSANVRFCFYDCTASRPQIASQTIDGESGLDPSQATETISLSAKGRRADKIVRAKIIDDGSATYRNWFDSVPLPTLPLLSVSPPNRLRYQIGDALDLSGLTVTVSDKGRPVNVTDLCSFSPAEGEILAALGAVTLSVSYGGAVVDTFALSVDAGEIVASGDWWTLYATGLLHIYCVGDMPNYGDGQTPWNPHCASITCAIISDSVTSIGEFAFKVCINLLSVTIPDSVTSIGEFAFSGCRNLLSVTIPDSVTGIGYCVFSGCSALTSVTIPDSVTSIGGYAFGDCNMLTNIVIPDSVTSIGKFAFSGCRSLTSVMIGNSVTSIGEGAFRNCIKLLSVTIPDSVTSIGGSAFYNCRSLTSVTIGNSVTFIRNYAFEACNSLTSVTISDSVTSIGGSAFRNCINLLSVTIPDSVTSIGEFAFFATAIASVTINRNCTVGSNAFPSGCVINYYDTSSDE